MRNENEKWLKGCFEHLGDDRIVAKHRLVSGRVTALE